MEMTDSEIARRMAVESNDVEVVRRLTDEERRRFDAERDRPFAERMQRSGAPEQHQRQHSSQQHSHQHQQQHSSQHQHSSHQHQHNAQQRNPIVPQPRGVAIAGHHFSSPSPSTTPPLPVMSNGDVPTASHQMNNHFASHHLKNDFSMKNDLDDVLPHVRGGVRYNDEQYLVKLARSEYKSPFHY